MTKLYPILLFLAFFSSAPLFAQNSNWVAPDSANSLKNPFENNTQAAAAKGQRLFNQMCAICHGRKGDGTGGGGMSLTPKPANFLSKRVKEETDGALFWKMTQGNPPMASYRDMLSEDQRWELVNYIRTLEGN